MKKETTPQPFAVIETGGKQYRVHKDDVISVEKIDDVEAGKTITLDKVLLIDDLKDTKVGTPYISGAKVTAECIEHGKGKKLNIIRFRSKSNWHRRLGHRQPYTKLKITSIA